MAAIIAAPVSNTVPDMTAPVHYSRYDMVSEDFDAACSHGM
jgi:hypothetical protein